MTRLIMASQVVDLQPDDVLVIHVDEQISAEEASKIKRRIRHLLDTNALVFGGGIRLAGAAEGAGTPIYDALLAEIEP